MDVVATFLWILLLFHHHWVGLGVGILAYACDLPRNLYSRRTASDLETVVGDLLGNVQPRTWRAEGSELVAEIPVHRLELVRKLDNSLALGIEDHRPVVDVFHLGRFNRGVQQILVGWIERVIDFEIFFACGY